MTDLTFSRCSEEKSDPANEDAPITVAPSLSHLLGAWNPETRGNQLEPSFVLERVDLLLERSQLGLCANSMRRRDGHG